MKLLLAFFISLSLVETVVAIRKLSESLRVSWCNGGGYAQYKDGELLSGQNCSYNTYCCQGSGACTGFTGTICHGNATHPNCDGLNSCRDAEIELVKGGSCVNGHSCYSASIGVVEDNSCIQGMSCAHAEVSMITNSSCIGYEACHVAHLHEVQEESCIGKRACSQIGNTKLKIRGQSCMGTESCYMTRIQDTIQNGSCQGNYTCGENIFADRVNAGMFHFRQGHKCDAEYCSCLIASTGTIYEEVKSACPRFKSAHVVTSLHKDSHVAKIPNFEGMRECYDNMDHSWLYLCGGGSEFQFHHGFDCNYFTMFNPENSSDIWAFYSTDGLNVPPFCSEVDLSFLPSAPSVQPSEIPTSTKFPSLSPSIAPSVQPSEIPTSTKFPSLSPSIAPSANPTKIVSAKPTSTRPSSPSSAGAQFLGWNVLLLVSVLLCVFFYLDD